MKCCLYRLEAATSRLEDMATTFEDGGAPSSSAVVGSANASTKAQSASEAPKSETAAPSPPSIPPQVEDFDELIKEVQSFVSLGEKIGGLVAEQVRYYRTMILFYF